MKHFIEYIKESINVHHGDKFSKKVNFELSQWDEWKKTSQNENYEIYEDPENGLYTVYVNKEGKLEHIATYLIKDQKLFTDNLEIFGIEE